MSNIHLSLVAAHKVTFVLLNLAINYPVRSGRDTIRFREIVNVFLPFVLICCVTVLNHREGRGDVKCIRMFESWLNAAEQWLINVLNASKCVRTRSKKCETARTGYSFADEQFQNIGTFVVAKSTVFSISSAQITHLARDAYNA